METSIEVEAPCGKLRGVIENTESNIKFYAFKGIPYAEPPIGELRFQDPVPHKKWQGIRDAKKFGPASAQISFLIASFTGEEDCLYLNVYTKSTNNRKLPVMVWIHGGGFVEGSGDYILYGPHHFLRKDVVIVTFNYRLGVLGFLNLEDDIAPGNQGLKDQVLALKWVQENISSFGGDPDNVTIFGESAGAASVHYLCLSPLAKGLFHKAISQSGVAINTWASMIDPKEKVYRLCSLLGNDTRNHEEIVQFLKTINVKKLIESQDQVLTKVEKTQFIFPFGPGVDKKSKKPFLPMTPELAAKNAVSVPYLLGYNSNEGSLIYFLEDSVDENLEKYLHPRTIEMLYNKNLTIKYLKNFYFGNNGSVSNASMDQLANLLGDENFVRGIHKVAQYQTENSSTPTYLYKFTYKEGKTLLEALINKSYKGVGHADELIYLFSNEMIKDYNVNENIKTSMKYKMMNRMIEMWTNFAKTGRPTIEENDLTPNEWLPLTDGSVLRYLNISENPKMETVVNINEKWLKNV